MKTFGHILLLFFVSISAFAQEEKPVDSKITNVTVFLNKAQITREVKTQVNAGKTNLILKGLTSQLDQRSVQVSGKGDFTILGISHQQNYLNEFNTPKLLARLKDSVEYIQRRLTLENSKKEILNKEEQMLLSNQKIGGTNQNLTVAELRSMADFYRSRLNDIVTARMKQDIIIKDINEKLTKFQRQVNEQNDLYSRNTSEIVVTVAAETATSAAITIDYIVANAGWVAVYDLRATNITNPVQLSYKANVFQATGEEWKNVRLKLSTANPALGGVKPELVPWYVNFYQPQYGDKKYKSEVAGQRAAAAYLEEVVVEEAKPAEKVSTYVSTIQTSLNTEFDIALPYSIASSNKPTVVDIQQHALKAEYTYSVAPRLEADAFLLARVTGWEAYSLLPGEANVFFEGTFVGKSYIDPNNIKDTLSVSLGRDKRIIVKREKLKDFSSRKLIGTQQRESYAYEISVRNTKRESVRLIIEDQVPVSGNNQIEVTVGNLGNAHHNKDTGKLSWQMTLKPGETKKVGYSFEVKYPKDKNIAGL